MAAPSTSSSSTTNIMLAIFEKKTTSVDLYRPLRNYIAFNYSEREAQNLEDDLQTLKQYRSDLERQPDPTPTSRRDLLQNYFKALCLVETRFPISPDKDHINIITFTWNDAFNPYPPTVTNPPPSDSNATPIPPLPHTTANHDTSIPIDHRNPHTGATPIPPQTTNKPTLSLDPPLSENLF
uniref:BRO1 domain-containing protein n=1 Tax=Fagus sylvatica TaxID=28930 RepID=A0A2N9F970_FAGSY